MLSPAIRYTGRRQSPFNWIKSPKVERRRVFGIRLTTIAAPNMSGPTSTRPFILLKVDGQQDKSRSGRRLDQRSASTSEAKRTPTGTTFSQSMIFAPGRDG